MRAVLLGLLFASAAFTLPTPARADHVAATRSDRLKESAHTVRLTMHTDHATLEVLRSVYNGGPRHDQATFFIDLPAGAVATSLATLGSLAGRPHWFAGELMEAEAAAAKYRELTGIGGYYPKDPALLSWRSQDRLALQVFPCPPAATKSVKYTLKIPTEYSGGSYHVRLPAMGTEQLLATVTARTAQRGDQLLIDGKPHPSGSRVPLQSGAEVEVGVVPRQQSQLGGELDVVPIADQRVLGRYRFEAAPKLSQVPRGAYVAVLIDASHSLTDFQRAGAAAAMRATLAHFPAAQVEVIPFARQPQRRHGRFVPVAQARADLEQLSLTPANGSNLDAALLEADRVLAKAPRGKARRILLLTDGRTRNSLTPARLGAAVAKSGALVHVGVLSVSGPRLERDDDHPWASAIRKTGGLVWQVGASDDPTEVAERQSVFEEWARPVRIDRLALFSPDLALESSPLGLDGEHSLDEGEALEHSSLVDRKLAWMRLEGELWATPVRRVLTADPARTKLWSALVFGTDHLDELSEPEMMTLAMRGGAVSPVTSYLAIEPGVRPSTEGLEWGLSGVGMGAGGRAASIRLGRVGTIGKGFDHDGYLKRELAAAWSACGGAPGTASVRFETTLHEVVDVTYVSVNNADPLLPRCLSEAVWSLALPHEFDEERHSWTVGV